MRSWFVLDCLHDYRRTRCVARLQGDAELLTRMAEEVLRRQGGEMSTAMAQVQKSLDELALALDRVVPSADEIDAKPPTSRANRLRVFVISGGHQCEPRHSASGFLSS